MAITGIQLRCGSDKTKSLTYVAPSGGVVGGAMALIGAAVGVFHETKAEGESVGVCIAADKIVLPKAAGSGLSIAQGGKIYFDATAKNVTPTATDNTLCGRALAAAGANDATVLAVFNGVAAA